MRIALVSSKGGVGKSSLAIALAVEAMQRGRSVLLADGDIPQGTCLLWAETATASGHPAPTTVAVTGIMHRPDQLPKLGAAYDWIVVDTPGRLGDVQRSALMLADVALVPTGPSPSEVWALAPALDVVRDAMALRPGLVAALVITRKHGRTAVGKGAREALEKTGLPILRTELGYRMAWQESTAHGLGVSTYDRGKAALELRRLFDEVEALGARGETDHGKDRPAGRPARRRRTKDR